MLNWYDFITPTSPFASILFGIIITIIVTVIVWWDSKEVKSTVITFIAGLVVTIGGVIILYFAGYYG